MILKCAQHISLPERSHPPKLIKNYIAISCLIKATLCSENPAQLSNGCYSMKAGRICLRERRKTHMRASAHTPRQSILYFQRPAGTEDGQDLLRWRWFGKWSGSGAGNGTTQSVTERQIALPSLRFHRLPNWLGLRRAGPNRHFLCCHLNTFQLDMANRRQLEYSSLFQLRMSW